MNLIGLTSHLVYYIQYLWWRVVERIEERFQLAKVKFDRDGEGGREALLLVWGIVVSIFEMDQNWN